MGSVTVSVTANQVESAVSAWPADSWETGDPASAGLNAADLASIDDAIARDASLLSAALIVRNGKLVYARYADSYDAAEPLHVWSVSKSITGIAVGFALQEGLLSSLDQTIGELVPERIPPGADSRVWDITLEQLLSMTAGWAWDSRINFARAAETDDLDQMMLRPFQCEPGSCFEYDSGCSNILAAIVEEVSGVALVEFLQSRLFDPLGIDPPDWIVTPDDVNRGGGGAFLSAEDMARIGLFALHQGAWNGEQLLNRDWMEVSTSPQSSGNSHLSGTNIGTGAYGYQWWVATSQGYKGFAAIGYGGQMIYVVPALDLVVVTAFADADPLRADLQQPVKPIIEEVIVPAIAD